MVRFTRDQLIISELMVRLIDIYYMEDIFDSNDELDLKHLLKLIKKFPKYNARFIEELRFRQGEYGLFPGLEIDFEQLNTFRYIMDNLRSAIIKKQYNLFWLHRVEDDIQTSLPDLESYFEISVRSTKEIGVKSILEKLQKEINKGAISSLSNQIKYLKNYNGFKISSECYRILYVEPISPNYGLKILRSGKYEEPFTKIYPIWFKTWDSFIDVVKSIIVNFQFAFGGFHRLKVCKNCQKLTFEKKENSKESCGKKCRTKHSKESENRENFLCRNRQNAWINNKKIMMDKKHYDKVKKIKNVGLVQKNQCKDCIDIKTNGSCLILKEKNTNFFNALDLVKQKRTPS